MSSPIPAWATIALPSLAYGLWHFAESTLDDATSRIDAALDAGITLMDTADIYGYDSSDPATLGASEALLGRVLAASPSRRDRMILATKGGIRPGVPYDSSAAHLTGACEASLRRLGVDHVDLYQVHRPDHLTHPEALADALAALVDRGLTRGVGVSNYSGSKTLALAALLAERDVRLASQQPELSALHLDPLDDGVLDVSQQLQLALLAYSPLAGGRLAEAAHDDPQVGPLVACLDRQADEHGVSRSAIALAWLMQIPAATIPIIGTRQLGHLVECAAAIGLELPRSAWHEILVAARQASTRPERPERPVAVGDHTLP